MLMLELNCYLNKSDWLVMENSSVLQTEQLFLLLKSLQIALLLTRNQPRTEKLQTIQNLFTISNHPTLIEHLPAKDCLRISFLQFLHKLTLPFRNPAEKMATDGSPQATHEQRAFTNFVFIFGKVTLPFPTTDWEFPSYTSTI